MESVSTHRRDTALAVGVAALVPVLYHLRVVLGVEVFFGGEILYMHYPFLDFVFRTLAGTGSVPEWTFGVGAGLPLPGNIEVGLCYPLNWLLYPFADLYRALNVLTVLHYSWAAAGTALLARHWHSSPAAAVVAGAVYSLNGFMSDNTTQLMSIETTSWLPLLLLLTDRCVIERQVRWAVAAGACGGVALLGAMTQYALCGALICGGHGLVLTLVERRRGRGVLLRRLGLLALIGLLASGVFAVQLLPTLELLGQTRRAEMTLEDALGPADESLGVSEAIGLIAPSALGGRAYEVATQGTSHGTYVGVLVLCLAVLAGVAGRPRARFLWAVVVFGVGLALGRHVPLFALFFHSGLPGVSLLKDPNRYVFLLYLPLGLLAASGLDTLLALSREPGVWRHRAVKAAVLCWVVSWSTAALASLYTYGHTAKPLARADLLLELGLGLALPLFAALALSRPLRLAGRRLSPGLVLAGAVLLELTVIGPRTDEVLSRAAWNRWSQLNGALPAIAATLPPGQRLYSEHLALGRNLALSHDLLSASPKGALLHERYVTLTGLGRTSTARDRFVFREFLSHPAVSRLLGVGCVATAAPRQPWLGGHFRPRTQVGAVTLYCQEGAQGLVRLVGQGIAVTDRDASLRAVIAPGFSPEQQTVLEDADTVPGLATAGDQAPLSPPPGRITAVKQTPGAVTARLTLERPGLLVLHQAHDPGWAAALDGQPARLLHADHAFQAVAVPAGEHQVNFTYHSAAFARGAWVTVATLALMAVLLALSRLRVLR